MLISDTVVSTWTPSSTPGDAEEVTFGSKHTSTRTTYRVSTQKIVPTKYMGIAVESFAEVKKCHQWKVCEDQTCGRLYDLISPSNSAVIERTHRSAGIPVL